jgi:hypothetical protein
MAILFHSIILFDRPDRSTSDEDHQLNCEEDQSDDNRKRLANRMLPSTAVFVHNTVENAFNSTPKIRAKKKTLHPKEKSANNQHACCGNNVF